MPKKKPIVRIEPFTKSFLTERYVSWLNNKDVVRYSEQRHRAHTIGSCRAYLESFANSPHLFWAIVSDEFGHVGNMTATVDPANRTADLAIIVGERRIWGSGIGTQAWCLACRELLKTMRKVTAGTMSINKPMIAIMRSTGMEIEGVRKRQFLCEGQEVDLVFAAKWQERSQAASP